MIAEPPRQNPLIRFGVALAERIAGRRMEPARLLAWYPRAAAGSGVLEALVAHREPSPRLLKLVRVTASLTASCAFCVDMNSYRADQAGVSDAELEALQAGREDDVTTFSEKERTAIAYARAISSTPLNFGDDLTARLQRHFDARQIVILATTAAQVNYWARTIQALGIQPAGFCRLPGSATAS